MTTVGIDLGRFAADAVWQWSAFLLVLLASFVFGRMVRTSLQRFAADARKEGLAFLSTTLADPVVLVSVAVGFGLGQRFLVFEKPGPVDLFSSATHVLNALSVGYVFYRLVDLLDFYFRRRRQVAPQSKVDDILSPMVGKTLRVAIGVLVLLDLVQILSGQSITAIVAGLGVGGLAVALAGQETIKNFFGSIVILADRPFEIGDRIVVDGHDGPVETVGFRSTRIRTLDGDLVTVPNSEMVNKTVRNVGKRTYIRRTLNLGITYDTPPDKVRRAVEIVKGVLADQPGMHPDNPPRVFFAEFGESSLNIVAHYWFSPADYWAFAAFSEHVNFRVLEQFSLEGIEFAFPSRTLYLSRDDRGLLKNTEVLASTNRPTS
jgi:MscS family membrane protein